MEYIDPTILGLLAEKLWDVKTKQVEFKSIPHIIQCPCKINEVKPMPADLDEKYIPPSSIDPVPIHVTTQGIYMDGVKRILYYGRCHKCQTVYWGAVDRWK